MNQNISFSSFKVSFILKSNPWSSEFYLIVTNDFLSIMKLLLRKLYEVHYKAISKISSKNTVKSKYNYSFDTSVGIILYV